MDQLTRLIINTASAEGGRLLVTGDLIRLVFPDSDSGVRFLTALNGEKRTIRLLATQDFKSVDIELPDRVN